MPTISGAIIEAARFQATSGPSTFAGATTMSGANSYFAPDPNTNADQGFKWTNRGGITRPAAFGYNFSTNAVASAFTLSDAGAGFFAAGITATTTITTGAPTGGAGAWKLGIVNAVSPTAPNRTVAIDVGGTLIYLHGKTTND